MTPAEFNEYAAEYGTVQQHAFETAKAASYWTAVLGRAERLPSFEDWMNPPKPLRNLEGDEAEERLAEHNLLVKRFAKLKAEKEQSDGDN